MSGNQEHWEDPFGKGLPFRLVFSTEVQGVPGETYERDRWAYTIFEYVLAGRGTLQVDGPEVSPQEGDAYALPMDRPHRYTADRDEPWRKIYMVVKGSLVSPLLRAHGLDRQVLFPRSSSLPFFEEMLDLWNRRDAACQDQACLLFHRFLLHLKGELPQEADPFSPPVRGVLDFIEANLETVVGAEDLAAAVGRSTSHLTRLFKKEVGRPPYEHLLFRRVEYACELLDSTDLPVREIAARLCYADAYYFSNAFKKQIGRSPLHYRKRV